MKAVTSACRSPLLHSPGWDDCVDARFLRASDAWHDVPEFRSHGHVLRRLFEDKDIASDAVVCVEGRPTVCLKDARQLPEAQVERSREKLWNLGATTLLVVERPRKVQVFSTLAKPSKDDSQGVRAELASETIGSMEAAELALRVRRLIRRVETGAIYREHKTVFNFKDAVDQSLLHSLRDVRNLICPRESAKDYRRAHAIIGKFLFSCYLLDRGIIGPAYLNRNRLPAASDMMGFLDSQCVDRARILESLFLALQRDFNGSLFVDEPCMALTDTEVDYLWRFTTGEDLQSGQKSLFKLYDFSFVPVELISSIYQEFIGAEAAAEAKSARRNQLRNNGQRTSGAYYTPPRLAELAVDIATEGWDTLLDKRCLDPACGSGIFLVVLFVRMAEEWRKCNPNAAPERRYKGLMRLLSENLCGADIHLTACLVTCFSLYLAFLDQMEPKEIVELREALERDTRAKLLPRILWERDKSRPRPPRLDSVRELDFFQMDARPEFDLVVGNPPWVSRKDAPTAEAWLFSTKHNPAMRGIKRSERNQTLFPAKELACAFMWKAGRHVRDTGRVCQVLPSRVFLSNNTDRFQAAWLKAHRLESVWLLADHRFMLFPGADCPCLVARYHPRGGGEALGEFEFLTPKVEWLDPREALIAVQPDDQKVLDECKIVAAAERSEAAFAWKQHYWGTPRDARLIERLMRLPRLLRLAKKPPSDPDAVPPNRVRQWFKGRGFQPATGSTERPQKVFWKPSDLFIPAGASIDGLVLLEGDCEGIGGDYRHGLHRKRSPLIYKSPLVLINQACTKFLFSDFDVLFQHDFQSICAPKHEEDELLFLTAVLSSPLAQYLLFHTTANIGIERDVARLEEILELPFPLPEDMPNRERSQAIVHECANLLRSLKQQLKKPQNLLHRGSLVEATKRRLVALVYDYFEICEWERHLIEDTVNVFRPSSTPGSLDSTKLLTVQPSRPTDREAYANLLVGTFRGWTRTKANLWAEGCIASESGLGLVTMGVGGRAKPYRESRAEDRVEVLLARIRKSTVGSFRCLRGFAFYEGAKVHLLKPLNRRHWTRTTALNDADEILGHMMREDRWGV